ncbi:hypothetical protein KKC1_09830 [Calderihabitans maritimus]|uniref:Uncharacterized protein n=1 Tax=Calderihabitans maritimus TaxID=1246530 RepID=A0A1Z5HQL0_9FIRM|nr:hypothetical protein KKC1_09830 [Calderihabitans maritimus]
MYEGDYNDFFEKDVTNFALKNISSLTYRFNVSPVAPPELPANQGGCNGFLRRISQICAKKCFFP